MTENDRVQPPDGCQPARLLLQDLWVDGRLADLQDGDLQDGGLQDGGLQDGRASGSREVSNGRLGSGRSAIDSAILRHIEACPACRQEADELSRLGQSLHQGLDSLCGAISETMSQEIEGTLDRIRELSTSASILRRIRRPLRLVLWIGFLAFSLLASVMLAVAVYRALKGL